MDREEMALGIRSKVLITLEHETEVSDEAVRRIIDKCVCEETRGTYLSLKEKAGLKRYVFDSIRRLDIISPYLDDEDITEIMVNGPDNIFVERGGFLERLDIRFLKPELLDNLIQQIVARVNRQVNEASPIVDARLEDGSRINIVLKPIALDGPIITIRKFPRHRLTMNGLIKNETITREAAGFLKAMVEARYNIFISGGTGSGKTTLLNCLSEFIDRKQRVITIEDSAELQLQNIDNLVRLESRGGGSENTPPVTIRELIKSALRMRPDRLIVGEVRGEEALDMLQAMNTGHEGSLSSGHANSAQDMMKRLETMVLTAVDIPLAAIRGQIASALDIVVQVGRLRDGSRRILSIEEVLPYTQGEIALKRLFEFEEEGESEGRVIGSLKATGERLEFRQKLERAGKRLDSL